MQSWRLIISAVAALTIFSSPVLFAQNTADGILEPGENLGEDLAKESQNPIGNIVSLPFENNFDFLGGIGRLVIFGMQPVDLKLQGFYNVDNPKGTADWSLQLQVKLLSPK